MNRKTIKIVSSFFCIIFLLASSIVSAKSEAVWLDSFAQAQKQAHEDGKIILANFTGSDWCQFCIKAEDEFFATAAFSKYAKENLVLLKVDFPRMKMLSKETVSQNESLLERYNIKGFPTHLFLSADGAVIGRTGYVQGGVDAWLKSARDILENRPVPGSVEFAVDIEKTLDFAKRNELYLLVIFHDSKKEGELNMLGRLKGSEEFAVLNGWKFNTVLLDKNQVDYSVFSGLGITKEDITAQGLRSFLIDYSKSKLISKCEISNIELLIDNIASNLDFSDESLWLHDYNKALFLAKRNNKPVLMTFTGKDWCQWCIKMENEVFEKDEFKKFAKNNMVLLELDFPMSSKLDPKLMQQNEWLSKMFDVKAFPTVVVVNKEGTELARGSYTGNSKDFVKGLQSLIKHVN